MRKRIIAVMVAAIVVFSGCSKGKVATRVNITPEQAIALAKTAALGGAVALHRRIATLEQTEPNSERTRIVKIATAALDEFNRQVADIVTLDVDTRRNVRVFIDKALSIIDGLSKTDVLRLSESVRADVQAGIQLARTFVDSFMQFVPAQSQP